MSRDKYPKFNQAKALNEPHNYMCGAEGCSSKAEGVIRIKFSYMRGEDECVFTCREHAKGATIKTKEFCYRFPPEAWK